jgi:hypothetical protein
MRIALAAIVWILGLFVIIGASLFVGFIAYIFLLLLGAFL